MSSYRRYIVALLLLTVGWVAVIATVNVVVDPYAVFGSQRTEGLNSRKPEFNKRLSKAKVVEVARLKPENLILGNSRADRGLDPYHSCWESEPVYNMAIPGSTITDIYWYLNYALEVAPIRRVVIDLDFLQMFNLFYRDRIGEPSIPAIVSRSWDSETLVSIFSLDALKSSMRTLTKQNQVTQYSPRGHMRTHQPKEPQDYASVFLDGYMKMQAAIDRKGLFDAEEAQWRYRNFEQMLRLAHEQGVELVLVVSPLHARYLSLIEKVGVWAEFTRWKDMLHTVNQNVARELHRDPFYLWDFALNSNKSKEEIPESGTMLWHQNFTHYSVSFGDLVLDQVLGCEEMAGLEGDEGVLLQ